MPAQQALLACHRAHRGGGIAQPRGQRVGGLQQFPDGIGRLAHPEPTLRDVPAVGRCRHGHGGDRLGGLRIRVDRAGQVSVQAFHGPRSQRRDRWLLSRGHGAELRQQAEQRLHLVREEATAESRHTAKDMHLHDPQATLVGDRLGYVDDLAGGQTDARA